MASSTAIAPLPNLELARARYTRGLELYKAHDSAGALSQFEDAFVAAPVWQMRFNLAQLHGELNHPLDAREELEAYLSEGGGAVTEERRREVATKLHEIAVELASAGH